MLAALYEMTAWVLLALPETPPICMKSGAPPLGLTCSAHTKSSDRSVGVALNLPLSGVTGWQVKYEPQTCVCGSVVWPKVPWKLHSFMARIPRTIRSLLA